MDDSAPAMPPGTPPAGKKWVPLAGRRLGALTLSVLCGVTVPLSPLGAEYFVTGQIEAVSWFAVGVTYVAGVGLVSKSQTILVTSLLAASVLAFVYGVDMKGVYDALHSPAGTATPLDPEVAIVVIGTASLLYLVERVDRHLIKDKPFLEV